MSKKNNDFEAILRNQLKELMKEISKSSTPKYLTRNQVAEMLSISLTTLWRYTKKGIVSSYQIGNRVLYDQKEVQFAVIKLNN
jgi:predicted DNA-binding transcriptional regulator AlpA|tara:strand:- start:577 stop:825 length:249 start_codon:yes stop_codon:yes gene_type:complete